MRKNHIVKYFGRTGYAYRGTGAYTGKKVTGPAPERGVVYQKTSLFPWMTVEENVGFGPKVRHMPENERKARIKNIWN